MMEPRFLFALMLAIPYQGNCSEPTDAATMRGEIRRFTLALCGFAMLAAQLFHIYLPWLIARPAMLAFLMLMLFGTPMLLFPLARSPITLAVLVAMAGWSPACGSAVKARLLHRGSVRSNRRPASGRFWRRSPSPPSARMGSLSLPGGWPRLRSC